MPLRWLYLDLNSFFASCEQQTRPALRGKPVAVLPMLSDSTSVIAASYQAKKYGVKTGTRVSDAREMCPGIQFVTGQHKLYVEYHHKVLEAIDTCVPIEAVTSIDEVACRLTGDQQKREVAVKLAQDIKKAVARIAGECLTCSIGIAGNTMLAKTAADMQKPDGLTVLADEDLPKALYKLHITDFPGIGPRMARTLYRNGVYDVPALYGLSSMQMRSIWGGVHGARFHMLLHGEEVPSVASETQSIGHQHVLEPALRNAKGAAEVTKRLLIKGAERMRSKSYFCKSLTLHIKFTQHQGGWAEERHFTETQDTAELLQALEMLWKRAPNLAPLRVGITLHRLVAATAHQQDLFTPPRKENLLKAIDGINRRYGRNTISFGLSTTSAQKALSSDKIAFQHVPQLYEAS